MRILFFADSHLGIDYPQHRKSSRAYRGDDFFNNFQRLLKTAEDEQFDLVIHGGDLFDRSKVPEHVVNRAYDMLFGLADKGIPIVLVPGNHDRSTLPTSLFLQHPNLHIFYEPGTFSFTSGSLTLQVAGFPFIRKIGAEIGAVLKDINALIEPGSASLLLMHQAVEGALVGPSNYMFRRAVDVIAQRDLQGPYLAYLSGHIHPHQVLPIEQNVGDGVPFIYPGSIEATSFAEAGETKGYVVLEIDQEHGLSYDFRPLPHRDLVVLNLPDELRSSERESWLVDQLKGLDRRAMVRIEVDDPEVSKWLSAAQLRDLTQGEQILRLRHLWLPRRANAQTAT